MKVSLATQTRFYWLFVKIRGSYIRLKFVAGRVEFLDDKLRHAMQFALRSNQTDALLKTKTRVA